MTDNIAISGYILKTVVVITAVLLLFQVHFWIHNNLYGTRGIKEDDKEKLFTIIYLNNRKKIIYIDNDNTEDSPLTKENDVNNLTMDTGQLDSSYYSDHVSTTLNIIEWDETIDYNQIPSPLKKPRNTCTADDPLQKIALVQIGYHGDGPYTNILYRYGDLNQLTFALPKRSSFMSYWPLRFHPSFIDQSLIFSNHVHMLVNSPYQYSTIKRFMKNSTIIAVLYDPAMAHLTKLQNQVDKNQTINNRKKILGIFETKLDNTSTILLDFGYSLDTTQLTLAEIINELEKQFDVVLMGDYILESLIVLKNFLCWSLNDFVFLSSKTQFNNYKNIPNIGKSSVRKRNKIDQAIFEHFNRTFWRKVESFGSRFTSDMQELQQLNKQTRNDCLKKKKSGQRPLMKAEHLGNIEPLCKRLRWREDEYISFLKKKPPSLGNGVKNGVKYLEESLRFFFSNTSEEILKLQSL